MKTILTRICIIFILSVCVVCILYLRSTPGEDANGGFKRNIDASAIALLHKLDIGSDSWYIAGTSNQYIYLGNTIASHTLMIAPNDLASTDTVAINARRLQLPNARIRIDSPYFYITDRDTRALLMGDLQTLNVRPYMRDETFFIDAIPLGRKSIIVRAVDTNRQNMLGKQMLFNPHISFNRTLLEKQVDGLLCTDGILLYNRELKRIIYVYFYRNQFICADTSMNLLYRANTIDTISRARIEPRRIGNAMTNSIPPAFVNKKGATYQNQLFIISNIIADNEQKKLFDAHSVIDVYDLSEGAYVRSIYIPDINNKKIKSFAINSSRMIVIIDHYLMIYSFSQQTQFTLSHQ